MAANVVRTRLTAPPPSSPADDASAVAQHVCDVMARLAVVRPAALKVLARVADECLAATGTDETQAVPASARGGTRYRMFL